MATEVAVRPTYGDVAAVARYVGLSETSVRRAIWAHDLEAARIGSKLVIAFAAADRWIARHRVGGAP